MGKEKESINLKDTLNKEEIFLGILNGGTKVRLYNKDGQFWNDDKKDPSANEEFIKKLISNNKKELKSIDEKRAQFKIAKLINNGSEEEYGGWKCICVEYSIPNHYTTGYKCGRQDFVFINKQGKLWFVELKVGYESCENIDTHYKAFCNIKNGDKKGGKSIKENIQKGIYERLKKYKELNLYGFEDFKKITQDKIDIKNAKTDFLFLTTDGKLDNDKIRAEIDNAKKINMDENVNRVESSLYAIHKINDTNFEKELKKFFQGKLTKSSFINDSTK